MKTCDSHVFDECAREASDMYKTCATMVDSNDSFIPGSGQVEWVRIDPYKDKGTARNSLRNGHTIVHRAVGHQCAVRCRRLIKASLNELSEVLITDSTYMYQRRMRHLYPSFINGMVLDTIVPRTKEIPYRYLGIKWAAFKYPGHFRPREFLVIEYVDQRKDRQGQTILFQAKRSIPFYNLPECIENKGYARGSIFMEGLIFTVQHEGRESVDARYCFHADVKIGERVVTKLIEKETSKVLDRWEDYINFIRLSTFFFAHQVNQIPAEQRTHCQICVREFRLSRRRYSCQLCGEVVCHPCTIRKPVDLLILRQNSIRVCIKCLLKARRMPRERSNQSSFNRFMSLERIVQTERLTQRIRHERKVSVTSSSSTAVSSVDMNNTGL